MEQKHFPHLTTIAPVLEATRNNKAIHTFPSNALGIASLSYLYTIPGKTFRSLDSLSEEEQKQEILTREARGIYFDQDGGKIIARPYHKFMNMGEFTENHPNALNWNTNVTIIKKLDGSILYPVYAKNSTPLCTRKGQTRITHAPQAFINERTYYQKFIEECRERWITPLFEWCSPLQPIIIQHTESRLILTGIRDIATGAYMDYDEMTQFAQRYGVCCVEQHKNTYANINEFINATHKLENEEGYVVWINGDLLKIKSQDYLKRHYTDSQAGSEDYILKHLIHNTEDDIIPFLTPKRKEEVIAYTTAFRTALTEQIQALETLYDETKDINNRGDLVKNLRDRKINDTAFSLRLQMNNKHDLYTIITDRLAKNLGTEKRRKAILDDLAIPRWEPSSKIL